jgi:modulator of FtsH protease HflK
VREPVRFLYDAADVEASLAALSEGVLARWLANRGIDELLTTGRAVLADAVARSIQSLADQERLGISIVAVRLGRLVPPMAVAPAFADAARARSDRRQMITRAEETRDRSRSEAAGRAREISDAAAGRFDRLVQPAQGEAQRFALVLAEARKDPIAFRRRLFLETIAEILPRFRRTVVVAPGQDLDISLLGDEPAARGDKEAPR